MVISLFSQSLIPIVARGFYAFHDTKTPLISSFAGEFIAITGSIVLALWFHLGIAGVAIAFSLGNIINFTILHILLQRKVKAEILSWLSLFKVIVIGTIMGSSVHILKLIMPFEGSVLYKIEALAAYVIAGAAVYFGLSAFLGMSEAEIVTKYFKRKKVSPVEVKDTELENL